MIKFAQSKQIHLFVLPAHTSHVLQPRDVTVFGPFKQFYYSECAAYMKANMGKVVTKYEIASIACTAYLKSMSPWNIVSAFKKAGIFPLNENIVPMKKLLPCEPCRDNTPLEKIKAIQSGKKQSRNICRKKKKKKKKKKWKVYSNGNGF